MRQQFIQAVQAFRAGDFNAARTLCAAMLEQHPGNPDVLQLMGAVLCEGGDVDAGIVLLGRAARERPEDPESWYNLGSAELKIGRFDAALESLDRALSIDQGHISALNNRGTALLELGRDEEARRCYEQVVTLAAGHIGALHNLANLDLAGGQLAQAEAGFRKALALDPAHHGSLLGLGSALVAQWRHADALPLLERAAAERPQSAAAWSTLARALNGLDRYEEALAAHRKATDLEPDSADHWNNLGSTLTSMERVAEAEDCLARALDIEPEHALAFGNMAALLELSNRLDDCLALLQRTPASLADLAALKVIEAKCLIRQKQPEDAVAILRTLLGREQVLEPALLKDGHFTLGQALDRIRLPAEAFEQFVIANRLAADWWRRGNPAQDRLLPAMRDMQSRLSAEWVQGWPDLDPPADGRSPAFLVGFQRSGTTLLDTMLGAHGGVHVMEEQPVLNRVIERMERDAHRYPGALAGLANDDWLELRRFYRSTASQLTDWDDASEQLLLDKSPLNVVHMGLITRLFPKAPVVLALRHPCDVCLSCLMQDFTLTPFMLNYTTLEGVASVYHQVMSLWVQYVELLGFPHHVIRYEDLVDDTEGELRSLVSFLGLPWRDAVLEHTRHARDRGVINTPSYHQVTQPVYQSSRYRWERYREQMQPVMPILKPWIESFGYSG